MMGLAVIWLLQIHMSWPLLLPFAAGAWISRRSRRPARAGDRRGGLRRGALIPGALLLPTLARYGLNAGSGGVLRNLHPHWVNPWIIVTTLARFLSFASLEISRFIATDGAKRLEFFSGILAGAAAIAVWHHRRGAADLDVRSTPAGRCGSGRRAMPRSKWAALRRFCWQPACCWSTPATGS